MSLTGSCIRGLEAQTHKYTLGVKIKRIAPHLAGGSFQLRSAQSQSVCERLHTEPWEGSFRFAEEEEDIYLYKRAQFTEILNSGSHLMKAESGLEAHFLSANWTGPRLF